MSSRFEYQGCLVRAVPPDPLLGKTSAQFINALAARLKARVAKVFIFGSFDTEDFTPWSDVDLLLVANSDRPKAERFKDFLDVLDLAREIDLVIVTPEEFTRLAANPPVGFWKSVFGSLKQVVC